MFLILFRLAGLEGLIDDDALRWMPKAKIMHLYTGNAIVQWFSNPRLAHAHLDYPPWYLAACSHFRLHRACE